MDSATRRGALGSFLGLGVAGLVGPRTAFAQIPLELPVDPLKLTRRLERSLVGDERIVVERSWQIDFTHQGQGVAVTGAQLHARVEAPAKLAPMTSVEEGRSTADMWPILLNANGLIMAAGRGVREEDVVRAVSVASEMIAARPIPAAQAEREIAYLAQLTKAGSSLLDRMPDDLFFPTIGPMHMKRNVDLPGGLIGEFELRYEAHAAPGRSWLENARREVVTRLAGTWQSAREDWSLTTL